MRRVNRPDTLYTELAELRRRLRLLETSSARRPAGQPVGALSVVRAGPSASEAAIPLLPARPSDWWETSSTDWERVAVTWCPGGPSGLTVTVLTAADSGTGGEIRVLVGEDPVSDPLVVNGDAGWERHGVLVPATPDLAEVELSVEARRTGGAGSVRVFAACSR